MRRESLRRHGVLDRVQGTGGVELFRDARPEHREETARMGDKKARKLGDEEVERRRASRTEVEERLEGYKGRGRAVERFREERPEMPGDG